MVTNQNNIRTNSSLTWDASVRNDKDGFKCYTTWSAFASVDNGVMHSKWAQNRLYNVYGDQELKIKQSQGI